MVLINEEIRIIGANEEFLTVNELCFFITHFPCLECKHCHKDFLSVFCDQCVNYMNKEGPCAVGLNIRCPNVIVFTRKKSCTEELRKECIDRYSSEFREYSKFRKAQLTKWYGELKLNNGLVIRP